MRKNVINKLNDLNIKFNIFPKTITKTPKMILYKVDWYKIFYVKFSNKLLYLKKITINLIYDFLLLFYIKLL